MSKSNKTGTREWSDVSLNAGNGCPHQCRYCYAKYNACVRFKQMTPEEHKVFVPNNKRIDAPAKKEKGVIMHPTIHDITPENLGQCMTMIRKNLDIGNKMLIVTKAHKDCMKVMCDAFQDYKDQLEFRITIGSVLDDVLKFWEHNAPCFDERLISLVIAYNNGYKTSISCEPTLDGLPMYVYQACIDYVTESFWIGLMNKIDQRCDFTGVSPEDMKKYVDRVKGTHSLDHVKMMYSLMKNDPKIKWKESIRDLLGIK